MAGTVMIPWYATGFRGDDFERELSAVAATALRYGATSYDVYRARDDRYKFQQFAAFEEYLQWERYWEGEEMIHFRTVHTGWFQVPVLYGWWDHVTHGATGGSPNGIAVGASSNGHGNGVPAAPEGDSL